MASKVNVKFVVILSACLVIATVGIGGAFFVVKYRSGDRYMRLGDRAMAEGNIDVADNWYERAVGKEPTNIEWLKKWRKAREMKTPTTQTTYMQSYQMYRNILKSLATTQKTNMEAHKDYFENTLEECLYGPHKMGWEFLARETDDHLRFFAREEPIEIRRYRGLALAGIVEFDPSTPVADRDRAKKDLEAAVQANPKDAQAAVELAVLYRVMSERAKAASDETATKTNFDNSIRVMQNLKAADATNPQAAVMQLMFDAADMNQVNVAGKSEAETGKARTAYLDALVPRVAEVGELLKKTGGKAVSPLLVNRFVAIAPRIDLKNGAAICTAVVDKLVADDPENMDLLLTKAQVMQLNGDMGGLIDLYQKVVDAKDKPVSYAGVRLLGMRTRARFLQANLAFQQVQQARDPEVRKAALEKAKGLRNTFARYVPEQSPELQFLDALLASIEGNVARSRQLLAEFLKKPGEVSEATIVEAMLLMADVGLRSTPPELGLARENLQRVVMARPGAVEVRMILAEVERTLQNTAAARAMYASVLEFEPNHEGAKKSLAALDALEDSGKKLDDPVLQALIDAERLLRGSGGKIRDDDGAEALLVKALEAHNYDPRLALQVASLRYSRNNAEGAKQVCDQCIEKNPEDKASDLTKAGLASVKDYLRRLKASDSLETVVEFVKQSNSPPVDKQLALFRTYNQYGKPEEAKKAAAEAERLAPDDPRVIELQFQLASLAGNTAEATRLADRAAKIDADHAEGETFKARMQINQKNYRDAAATLARCVDRGNATSAVYRLLGLVQAELGRMQDSMRSFRRSIELSPDDMLSVKSYLSVLIKAGETSEALSVARASEPIGKNDTEFMNTWLSLEAQAGRGDFARERRELIRKLHPKDMDNLAALAELYMDDKAWDTARQLIDELRKDPDAVRAVTLDARWHADRGALDKAKQVFRDFIGVQAGKDAKNIADIYMTFGQFLARYGSQPEVMAAFRQAASKQAPGKHDVDLVLADYQLTSGLFEDAEKTYRRMLDDQTPDADFKLRKRLIESLNQQQKFAAAEAEIAKAGAIAEDDVEFMSQRATAAKGLGDVKRAQDILSLAITKFPDEPMPYLRRARIVMQDKTMAKDAMADLATAIKLRPSFWQALRTRALLNLSMGKPDDGMRDLKEAADRNPGLDDLKYEVIDYLVRFGKETEAVDVADNSIKARPNDLRLIDTVAGIFARHGRWARAARFYKLEWTQLQDEKSATAYVNALMNSSPPASDESLAVLANPATSTDKSWKLLLMRALVKKKQGRDDACRADVIASFDLLSKEPKLATDWVATLRRVYPEPMRTLEMIQALRLPPELADRMRLEACVLAMEDAKQAPDGLAGMRSLRDSAKDHDLRVDIQRHLSEALIRQSAWEDSAKEIQLGLQLEPNDPTMSNNLASILSEQLNRSRDALPYAERACNLVPSRWEFADTLAGIHWKLGDKAQALRELERALRLPAAEADKAGMALKLGSWRLESGDKPGAKLMLDTLLEMMADSPTLTDLIRPKVEELSKQIEAVPGK